MYSDDAFDDDGLPITPLPLIEEQEGDEYDALEYLKMSLLHAQQAAERFEEGSKGESVSENVVAWAERSVEIAEKEVEGDQDV